MRRKEKGFTHQKIHHYFSGGFTLIELLVVIAIIGILASVIMASLNSARNKAKIGRAKSDLKQIQTAAFLLQNDTGKWLNGCPPGKVANIETAIAGAKTGLASRPQVGIVDSTVTPNCAWSAAESAAWNGPYWNGNLDPWGEIYYYDPDFCDLTSAGTSILISVISSSGPDLNQQYKGDCGAGFNSPGLINPNTDDIYLPLVN